MLRRIMPKSSSTPPSAHVSKLELAELTRRCWGTFVGVAEVPCWVGCVGLDRAWPTFVDDVGVTNCRTELSRIFVGFQQKRGYLCALSKKGLCEWG